MGRLVHGDVFELSKLTCTYRCCPKSHLFF